MSQFVSLVSYGGDAGRRERILKQKRERYQRDLAHRAAKQAEAKARYKPVRTPSGRKRGRNKDRVTYVEGKAIILVGLGSLADLCGVSKTAINRYEKRGVIPLNRLVDSSGRRWYPKPFAEWLAVQLKNQSKKREPLWRLKGRVEQAWQEARATIPVLEETP